MGGKRALPAFLYYSGTGGRTILKPTEAPAVSLRSDRGPLVQAGLIVLFVQISAFGIFLPWLGFYCDDWTNLERSLGQSGFFDRVLLYLREVAPSRPGLSVLYPVLFAVGGMKPWVYQTVFFLLESAAGMLLFVLLDRLFRRRDLALTAVVLVMLYPNHIVTHLWLGSCAWLVSLILLLVSLILHLEWIEGGRPARLAGSLACYAASVLTYEATVFLPLLLWGGLAARDLSSGERIKTALWRPTKSLAPYAAVLAAAALWQRFGLPLLLDDPPLRETEVSIKRIFVVYGLGLATLTTQTASLVSGALASAWDEAHAGLVLPFAAACAGLPVVLVRPDRDGPSVSPSPLWTAGGAATAGFLGAFLPYGFSFYAPSAFALRSRTSAGGALAGGILLALAFAAALRRCPPKGPRLIALRSVLGIMIGVLLLTNWHLCRQWTRSWAVQKRALAGLAKKADALPKGATVIVSGPYHVDNDADKAPIFISHWGFSSALRLATGRKDLTGDVFDAKTQFGPDGLYVPRKGERGYTLLHDYDGLFYYDYRKDLLSPITSESR